MSQATNSASLISQLLWTCINQRDYINFRFTHVLSSEKKINGLLDTVTFCEGLFDAVQAEKPPPLSWFRARATKTFPRDEWAVYIHVLQKEGEPPALYTGSGTAFTGGIRARYTQYERGTSLPVYVEKALTEGYKITHTVLAARCSIPAAADVPALRTAFVGVEAAFSCLFWTMIRCDKWYSFDDLCPWPRDSFEWKGLCSHNSLAENIYGDFDFTSEQLEEMAAAIKLKNAIYQEKYQKALRANPTEEYKARQKRNNIKQKPGTQERQRVAVANKQYYCECCKVACRDNASLIRHNQSPRHHKKLEMGDVEYHCQLCDKYYRYKSDLTQHCKTKTHLRNEERSKTRPVDSYFTPINTSQAD